MGDLIIGRKCMGPIGPRWALCWPNESWYLGCSIWNCWNNWKRCYRRTWFWENLDFYGYYRMISYIEITSWELLSHVGYFNQQWLEGMDIWLHALIRLTQCEWSKLWRIRVNSSQGSGKDYRYEHNQTNQTKNPAHISWNVQHPSMWLHTLTVICLLWLLSCDTKAERNGDSDQWFNAPRSVLHQAVTTNGWRLLFYYT